MASPATSRAGRILVHGVTISMTIVFPVLRENGAAARRAEAAGQAKELARLQLTFMFPG